VKEAASKLCCFFEILKSNIGLSRTVIRKFQKNNKAYSQHLSL